MTRTQPAANWSDAPSLSQLLLAALLRLAAMFVEGAACLLWMRPSRLAGECHADVTPAMLPSASSGNQTRETETAVAHSSQTPEALMVSSEQSSRRVYPELVEGSNHEGGLTRSLNESFPGKARSAASRGETRSVERLGRRWDRRFNAQSATGNNRDSRDALGLPGNDNCCCLANPETRS